ncbi:hypothetical protein [Clostridium rectalis]|uniref:hypothetical protein n=1 Tax=Clostridium rectalis TaxID=2040295 RepID=UPI000F63CB43|nr:hypothetical protein [Clostridium rectalis]
MSIKLLDKRPFNPDECYPWKGMRRCALTKSGTVFKYHNKDNTNLWEDGTKVDWLDYEKSGLNCMVEIPKFYFKKVGFNENDTDFENGHAWYISSIPDDGFELHPAFMRCRDKLCDDPTGEVKKVEYRYAPAFLGSFINGNLRSLPNKNPKVEITISQSRDYAKANGNGWSILDYNLYFAIQLLYSIEYGDYDSQTALGRGYVDGNLETGKINTGGTLQYGNHSYGETTGKKQMSYRGIEDFWGNCAYWMDGFFRGYNNILISNKGFNNTGSGYKNFGVIGTFVGYIRNIQINKNCGFIPSKNNKSDPGNLYDYGVFTCSGFAIGGGCWCHKDNSGVFQFDINGGASSMNDTTASVSF